MVRRRRVWVLVIAPMVIGLGLLGRAQTNPNLSGKWTPIKPTVAAVPPTVPVDVANSLGGPVTITDDSGGVKIDNGVVAFSIRSNGPAVATITSRAGSNSMTAQMNGRALWEGHKLRVEMTIPNIHRGPASVLYLTYYLDGGELVMEKSVAETKNDPQGDVVKIRYKRAE